MGEDMLVAFYGAGAVAVLATFLAVTRAQPVHALLYLGTSLLAIAVVFYTLGAPFVAALEVVVYAGAIVVLFVFVVMMLNLGTSTTAAERSLTPPRVWIGPAALSALVLSLLVFAILTSQTRASAVQIANRKSYFALRASKDESQIENQEVPPRDVGASLYGPYFVAVELSSVLLLAGMLSAWRIARRERTSGTQEVRK